MLGAGSSWNYLNILLFSQESPSSSWKLKILESESKHFNIWCGGRKTGKPHNGIHGSHYSSSKTRNTKTNTETNSKINIDKDRLTYNLYDTKQTNLDEDQPCDGILCSPYPSSGLESNSKACCLLVLPVHRKSLSFGRYKTLFLTLFSVLDNSKHYS